VDQVCKCVGFAAPVIAAVTDAGVQVQSVRDSPVVSILPDVVDLGIDSSGKEKGSSLVSYHNIIDTMLVQSRISIGSMQG
jgi:hypothetical protein